jgi:hypothetical protein
MGVAALAVASTSLAACASDVPDGAGAVQQRDRLASPSAPEVGGNGGSDRPSQGQGQGQGDSGDAGVLIEQALAAWESNDPTQFVSLLDAAADACQPPAAARRLSEVAVIAERWASALADGRPKVQATTENQLAGRDWSGLAAACSEA